EVFDAGADEAGGERRRLLTRAALGVDRGGGDFHRETLREPGGGADVERLLADLRHAAGDDLADGGGGESPAACRGRARAAGGGGGGRGRGGRRDGDRRARPSGARSGCGRRRG